MTERRSAKDGKDATSPSGGAVPDFRHVDHWIFDLDNTLYPASCDLFSQIDQRMTAYLAQMFAIDHITARQMQQDYYREHGTTLNGLIHLHGADPEAYLAYVHDIDLSVLNTDEGLASAIARLPGRRYVFTNGPAEHAARVLDRLGISRHFDDLFDIRAAGFLPKPSPKAYERLLARHGIVAQRAAMFEDIVHNLAPAQAMGMTTVWVKNDSAWSKQGPTFPAHDTAFIDHVAEELSPFLSSLRVATDNS